MCSAPCDWLAGLILTIVTSLVRGRIAVGKVAVMVLIDVAGHARLWGFWYFLFCRLQLARTPGLTFMKVMGSGRDGGFQLKPSASHQGLFCVFREERDADDFLRASPVLASYRQRARELLTVKLKAFSARGAWSGANPLALEAAPPGPDAPIAALTRASIRPAVALRFWRRAPAAEQSLHSAHGCLVAMGIGEAPLLRQATFSIWESAAAMDAYARSGAHADAIRAAAKERYFSESLFARFVPIEAAGVWKGQTGLQILRAAEPRAQEATCRVAA
jgi:heme-degrading monooxygenase HmoA